MADILADPMEICFGSFTATSTTLTAATSLTVSVKAPATPVAASCSNKKSKTHPPKPYDIIQGMERVIDMMEKTLQYARELNAQCRTRHAARPSLSVCGHPTTHTLVRRLSPSRSNLGDDSHLTT
jgi:hypothetical protein